MNREGNRDPDLWLQPRDEFGKPKDPAILAAAKRNWMRAVAYAERHGQDASVAAEALDAVVVALASLKLRRPDLFDGINNLDAYIYRSVIRRLNRLLAKEPALKYVGSLDDLTPLDGPHDSTWTVRIETEIDVKKVVGLLSPRIREMWTRRQMGYTWAEIARGMGTTALGLRVQFSQGIAAARKRVLDRKGRKPESASKPKRQGQC